MPETNVHYLDCTDPDCPGCLPTDDELAGMSIGQVTQEGARRGLDRVRAGERRQQVIDGAAEYRARAIAARA